MITPHFLGTKKWQYLKNGIEEDNKRVSSAGIINFII